MAVTTASKMFLLLSMLSGAIVPSNANLFLSRNAPLEEQQRLDVMSVEAQKALVSELEHALGGDHKHFGERRLIKIEERMRPIFNAVPKNKHGLLDSSAVTYLLHRVFVLRHGWFVRGLDPEDRGSASFNTSSGSALFQEKVPLHIQQVFEKRMSDKGATFHELAVLAATIEHLIHKEAMGRLDAVYRAQSYSVEDVLSEDEAAEVFDSYMALYILGFLLPGNSSTTTPYQVQKLREQIPNVYPNWPEVQKFVRDVKAGVAPKRDYLYFSEVANVIEEVGDRYGNWQDKECKAMKRELLAMEDPDNVGSGRVRLADFYAKAMNEDKFQFGESVDYLRQLGALDESDPSNTRVLIPNYVNSPSNCVASSSYYSVCCRNECEDLFGHLEAKIAKPDASPAEILAVVSDLASSSVAADRVLPGWLSKRLVEVAQQHHGVVPLHSRLFMQWLHFAYPRECPYPHVSGMTSYVKVADVVKNSDPDQFIASKDEMMIHISAPKPNMTTDTDAMWTSEEELIFWRQEELHTSTTYRGWFFMSSVVSGSMLLVRVLQASLNDHLHGVTTEKHFV